MRLAIAGAAGRMGRVLTRMAHEADGLTVAGGIEAPGSPHLGAELGELAGIGHIGVAVSADADAVLANCDGVIDFTVPAATLMLVELTAALGLVHVIGTTGIDASGEARITKAGSRARIVKSGNMSLGVNLLAGLVKQAAAMLGTEFDIEIVEMHHRHKIDAPSGTALLLGQAAASGRGIALEKHAVRGRDGHTGPRPEGTIGFASLRGGSVVGDHTVIFAGPAERIEFAHKAESRELFARGALWAAVAVAGKPPGVYGMADLMAME